MDLVCLILRGLPGSGKSALAELIARETGAVICSATHFFEQDGGYSFVPDLLAKAHAFCLREFYRALRAGLPVIIDNTHAQLWEYLKYADIARGAEYRVVVMEITAPTRELRDIFFARNVHAVPDYVFRKMSYRWEYDAGAIRVDWQEFSPDQPLPVKFKGLFTG